MWKYRYLGLLFPLKCNPDRIRQKPALELGRMWIALLAIQKGVHCKSAHTPPDNDRTGPNALKNGLGLSSDNPFGHPHNLEENHKNQPCNGHTRGSACRLIMLWLSAESRRQRAIIRAPGHPCLEGMFWSNVNWILWKKSPHLIPPLMLS